MQDKLIRQVNQDITQRLLDQELSGAPSRKAVQGLLKNSHWLQGLSGLLPLQERLSCRQVLELCAPILDQLSPPPEDGWLSFAYRSIRARMFPQGGFCPEEEVHRNGALFFLTVLQALLDLERTSLPFDPLADIRLLEEEEYHPCDTAPEYRRLLHAWRREFIYELMRLGDEVTPFRTLSHIAGVHFVAMSAARGLKEAGVDVDLALVSAAATTHDLGKFGCQPGERVPYLHYYYTDQWLSQRRMDGISHIAANHSVWDLELDALSVESLCLIYADFRSKQDRDPQGREVTVLYPLDESFQVILSKLDNVDPEKKRRYQYVYDKLLDFERYMVRLGVDVTLSGQPLSPHPRKDPALMDPEETLESLVLLSVQHNLTLMHMLSDERRFGNIIEEARSVKDWRQLRAYLNIFGEYFTYLSVPQKTQALAFLYDLLVHREGDIRRQAGSLLGQIIARFHLVYRKELPASAAHDPAEEVPFTLWAQYLDKIIYPDHKTTQQQRSHISYTLKLAVGSLLEYARPGDIPRFLDALLRYYDHPAQHNFDTAFTLLDAIRYLPPRYYGQEIRGKLIEFAGWFAGKDDLRLRTAALEFLLVAQDSLPEDHPYMARIVEIAWRTPPSCLPLIFLQGRLLHRAGENTAFHQHTLYDQDVTSEVFLDNLKIATPWVVKVAGIELLRDQVEQGLFNHILHISTHFTNLLKVSERVVVRHSAGAALIRIFPMLRREQRNEIVVELGKGLEMGEFEISKYIPQYLGQATLYLHPSELDEQVLWLKSLLGSPNDSTVSGALNTIGHLLSHYPLYRERFPETEQLYENRRHVLLGFLLQGLAHYRAGVRQEALLVIGRMLFENPELSMEEKSRLFGLCYRKLLFLIQESPQEDGLSFFYRAAALGHIYRFLALYRLDFGRFFFERPRKIAFFPGTFDPFTLSHKGIVHAIRDLGFEVYLAVDEFSWSKKAQPHLIRRQVVNLSVAGDFHVHLFPDDIPVNIANPADLKRLVELFPGQEVYLVAGSDVVANASAYQAPALPFSVRTMNHIIFRRAGDAPFSSQEEIPITGQVIHLQLPQHLEDISSTRIRENVDLNRDISSFIDPVIQDFIYQNGLYLRDSIGKPMFHPSELAFQWEDIPTADLAAELTEHLPQSEALRAAILQSGDRILLLYHKEKGQRLGFLSFRQLSSSDFMSAMKSPQLANRVRLRSAGRSLLITGLYTEASDRQKDYVQLLLGEALARALAEDCLYAMYLPHSGVLTTLLDDTLGRMGFCRYEDELPLLEVDMHAPLLLIQNLEATIQRPLSRKPQVLSAIGLAHERLQKALTDLYPGSLVLTLSADMICSRMLEIITDYNGVPATPTNPRRLGPSMCVPFGKLLRGRVIPNTVTKAIHTDKVFTPDLKESTMEAFPYYPSIPCQVRTIKSFNRPVILVDDLLHQGFRIQALEPVLRQEDVPVQMVLVGVLSSCGKDLMEARNLPVDSVYFLPRLRHWFVESTLCPFIGGNTVRRPSSPAPGLLPGINHILPYAAPSFRENCSEEAVYALSRACLECTRDVIAALEREYRALYARNLTLSRLPEAIILPLCPDKGTCLSYDPNLPPSVYLENDLEQLLRSHPAP